MWCIELMSEVIRMVSSAYCAILVGFGVPGAWYPLILVFDLISFASVSAIMQYNISERGQSCRSPLRNCMFNVMKPLFITLAVMLV